MVKKIYSTLMLLSVILISIAVMIIPTFFGGNISRVSLNQEFDLPLVLNDNKDIKIVFFGYSGCSDICTPRLYDLNNLYNRFDEQTKKRVGVEFLDISVPEDKTLPTQFAKFFNSDFKGIYLEKNSLREYTKEFNVYFSRSLMDKTEFDHTTHLYIVKKDKNKKVLRYIYSAYPYDFKQISLDIRELMNE